MRLAISGLFLLTSIGCTGQHKVATITKTIGAAGDYATPAAAAADFNAGTISGASASDDIVFEIIDNAAFDSTFAITANPTGYASYKLTVNSSVRHDGTYGSGARIAISTTSTFALQDTVAALNGTIEWLEITTSGSGKIAAGWLLSAGYDASSTKTMRNCMIHGNGAHSTSPFRSVGIGNPSNASLQSACNLVVTNTLISNWKSGSTVMAGGIGAPATGSIQQFYNLTIDDIDVTGGTSGTVYGITTSNHANKDIKNCVVTKIGTNTTTGTKACFTGNGGSTVGADNASSDATAFGTGSLTSIVRGDNFSDADNGDYRPLNDGAPIFGVGTDLGTTPTDVELDLKGRDRDANADSWSIGAYQLSAGGAVGDTVTINAPAAYKMHQRSSGTATVTVSGEYSGSPTSIEARVDSGSWTELDGSPAAGTFSGTISVAAGTRTIEVRFSNETDVTDSVSNVLVGDVFLIAGQSNAAGRLTNNQSYTHASQKAAMFKSSAWEELADPTEPGGSDGSPWPLVATQFLADQSVPCGFINGAEGGTALSTWWNGSAQTNWTAAKALVTSSGVNAIAAVLFDLGESDALAGTAEATFNSNLDGLAGDVQSTYGCPLIVAQTGTVLNSVVAAELDAIRSAQVTAWGDNANIDVGPLGYDRSSLHWESDAEGGVIADRWWVAIDAALFDGSVSRGPQPTSAVENSSRTHVIITFDQTLGTGLSLDSDPWSVDDDGTPATISGVVYVGNTVTVVLASALTGNGTTVTFASGDTGSGHVVPVGPDITLPDASTANLPAEPFYDLEASQTSSGTFSIFGGGIVL